MKYIYYSLLLVLILFIHLWLYLHHIGFRKQQREKIKERIHKYNGSTNEWCN